MLKCIEKICSVKVYTRILIFLLLIADLLLKITEIRDTLLQESEIIANLLSGYSPKTNHIANKNNKTYSFIFWIGGLD